MPGRRNPRLTVSLALVAAILSLSVTQAAAATQLRWKFQPGASLNYVLQRNVEGKLNIQGSPVNFKMAMVFDTAWHVKSVTTDGGADVEQTIERIQISMSSPLGGGDLVYDSKLPEQKVNLIWQQIGPMVESMLGETFRVKVTALGRVTDIGFPDKLTEALKKQQASPNRQAGFGIGGGAFSEKGIKELIERSVLPLPEVALGKDVTWQQHFETKIGGAGTQMADVTFSSAGSETVDGKPLEKIAATTELTFEPAEAPTADLEIISQEGAATFYFDPAAGQMIKASGTQASVIELSGPREVTQDIKETFSLAQGRSPEPKGAKPAETKPAEAK